MLKIVKRQLFLGHPISAALKTPISRDPIDICCAKKPRQRARAIRSPALRILSNTRNLAMCKHVFFFNCVVEPLSLTMFLLVEKERLSSKMAFSIFFPTAFQFLALKDVAVFSLCLWRAEIGGYDLDVCLSAWNTCIYMANRRELIVIVICASK